jgi:NAD(P)-dependent dehydrogenase (short-subunit alcohol dehydrogenase family)
MPDIHSTSSNQKIAFITGASGRLGKAMATALAERGWTICFTYLSSQTEAAATLTDLRRFSPASEMVQCNLADTAAIDHAFYFFKEKFSRLDLCITNASNFFPTPLLEVTADTWDNLVNTNLRGTFFTMQHAAKLMMTQDFTSRIITMSDVSAELIWRRYAPYTVSKLGIQHLTKIFAKECAPKILVNSIAPGTMLLHPERDQNHESDILAKIPLKRLGTPEDIVNAMLFLTETDYITGHTLSIDGGRLLF